MSNPIINSSSAVTRNESLLATNAVLRNTYFLLSLTLLFSSLTAWYATASDAQPLGILVLIIGMYGLMFLTMWLRNSAWGIPAIFAFTGFMGYTLGPILNHYITSVKNGPELIMLALGTTGVVFFSLSAYILTTRKNMNFLGGFLFAGMITAVVLMVASIWIHTTALQLAISGLFTLLSCVMILYHTSAIVNGGETNYIMATISLFVALFNLFLSLLQIFGIFSNKE
jgi:modulator of FtsH protease